MKLRSITATLFVMVAIVANQAHAGTFSAAYPSASSIVVASTGQIEPGEYGSFWSVARGDSITQTFTGTGLASVNELDLVLPITQYGLQVPVDWNVKVNNQLVGSWVWTPGASTGQLDVTYRFPDIVGADSYTVSMQVSNEVPPGDGSIAIGTGTMTLQGGSSVPDACSTLALFGLGLSVLGFGRRFFRS